jgi:hypothetical protein
MGPIHRLALAGALAAAPAADAVAAVTGYEVLSESLTADTNATKSHIVSCPEGKLAFGGGTTTLDVDGDSVEGETLATIWLSAPFGVPATGWSGAAYTTDSPSLVEWGLRVDVICGNADGLERVFAIAPLTSNAEKFTQAICPDGKSPLSGGAQTSGVVSSTQLHESVDSIDAAYGVEPGWAAVARGPATTTWNVQAIALCADTATAGTTSEYETTPVVSADAISNQTYCPAGLVAVGGSARAVAVNNATAMDGARLTAIGPIGPSGAPNGWFAMVRRPAANDADWRLSVGVVCAPEPDAGAFALVALLAVARSRVGRALVRGGPSAARRTSRLRLPTA